MIPASVGYVRPSTLDEALDALAEADDAAVLAGGHSLLPVLKLRIARPSVLVDVGRLGLRGITAGEDAIRIGALTAWDALARAPELTRPALAALSECADGIGDLQVRNRGTVGGSLVHADPAADVPAPLLALGASVVALSRGGSRTIAVSDLLVGPFTTSLRPDELVTEVVVPVPERGTGSAYEKVEHPASGFALAGAAAVVRPGGERAVALTGLGSRPFLAADGDVEGALAAEEVYGDDFAPAGYRRHLAAELARRAVERAESRASEETR